MTREEIVNTQNKIGDQLDAYVKDNVNFSRKKYFELVKRFNDCQRQLDIIDGKTYNCDEWITQFSARGETYKEARINLINKIKDLAGVEVEENTNGGVTRIRVFSEYKIYSFVIHAHNFVEEIPTGTFKKGMFGDEMEIMEYKHIVVATIDKDEQQNWIWRY